MFITHVDDYFPKGQQRDTSICPQIQFFDAKSKLVKFIGYVQWFTGETVLERICNNNRKYEISEQWNQNKKKYHEIEKYLWE